MFVPEKMKLNRLRFVRVPSTRELFSVYGFRRPSSTSSDTGQRKLDTLNLVDDVDRSAYENERYLAQQELEKQVNSAPDPAPDPAPADPNIF